MNREQWLRKRSHLRLATLPPGLGADKFAGAPFVKDARDDAGQAFAAIREQHFDDDLACDGWTRLARSNDDSGGDSH